MSNACPNGYWSWFTQVKALPPGVCKAVGIPRGAAPHPGPSSEMGRRSGEVISSIRQAEPYSRTSRATRARFARPCGQTLAARENLE